MRPTENQAADRAPNRRTSPHPYPYNRPHPHPHSYPLPPPPPLPAVKRVLDLLLATALLMAAAPLLAAAALALAARRPPGGVLVRSVRTGLGGHPFVLRSLRTRSPRLNALSRLPHVVRGDLSLVGPEPLAPGDPRAGECGPWRHELRPGLTGLAQVRSRSGLPWDEPALLDQHYADHHRTGLDLAILAKAARLPPRTATRTAHPGGPVTCPDDLLARLSDTDHRPLGYSAPG